MSVDFVISQSAEVVDGVAVEVFELRVSHVDASTEWRQLAAPVTREQLEQLRALISSTLRDADDVAFRFAVAKRQLALVWDEAERLAVTARTAVEIAK